MAHACCFGGYRIRYVVCHVTGALSALLVGGVDGDVNIEPLIMDAGWRHITTLVIDALTLFTVRFTVIRHTTMRCHATR